MDITFRSTKLGKVLCDKKLCERKYGRDCAKKIGQRLDELRAAPNLETMRLLPGRCHEMEADRKGQFSVDVVHPKRLLFRPNHEPVPAKPDGGIDWSGVTCIEIIEVEDTHG